MIAAPPLSIDAALGRLAAALIGGHQRFLSPWKGFVCAHRAVHGGDSCSQFIKTVVTSGGLLAGLRALRPRLLECRAAAETARVHRFAFASGGMYDEALDPPGATPKSIRGRTESCGAPDPGLADCALVVGDASCSACPDAGLASACDVPAVDCAACA